MPFLPLLNMSWTVLTPPTALHCEIMEVVVMRSPAPWGVGSWAVCKTTSVKHACSCVQSCSLRTLQPDRSPFCSFSCSPHPRSTSVFTGRPQAMRLAYDSKIQRFYICHMSCYMALKCSCGRARCDRAYNE